MSSWHNRLLFAGDLIAFSRAKCWRLCQNKDTPSLACTQETWSRSLSRMKLTRSLLYFSYLRRFYQPTTLHLNVGCKRLYQHSHKRPRNEIEHVRAHRQCWNSGSSMVAFGGEMVNIIKTLICFLSGINECNPHLVTWLNYVLRELTFKSNSYAWGSTFSCCLQE